MLFIIDCRLEAKAEKNSPRKVRGYCVIFTYFILNNIGMLRKKEQFGAQEYVKKHDGILTNRPHHLSRMDEREEANHADSQREPAWMRGNEESGR